MAGQTYNVGSKEVGKVGEGLKGKLCTYACAPSLRAIKGSKDQSLSMAGSLPSSTPSHLSTSGPLDTHQPCSVHWFARLGTAMRQRTWHGGNRRCTQWARTPPSCVATRRDSSQGFERREKQVAMNARGSRTASDQGRYAWLG
jgi:hypothetical protein